MTDADFMRRAIFHASRAEGVTTPNPMTLARVAELFEKTRAEVAKVIVGQERLVVGPDPGHWLG